MIPLSRPMLVVSSFLCLLVLPALASHRDSRFLGVFQIVKFKNDPCTTSDKKVGTCFLASECTQKGGEALGTCATGLGVCCKIADNTCGSTVTQNNTYWKTTASLVKTCTMTVCPCNPNVTQIRLDFDTFTTAGPDTSAALALPANATAAGVVPASFTLLNSTLGWSSSPNTHGQCNIDNFSSNATAIPAICGENAGQHMYIPSDGVTCTSFTMNLTTPGSQQWSIKVAQIESGMDWEAPAGCLQYFTGPVGSFNSFNLINKVHLANEDYDICIRQEKGMCNITYTASTFQISAVNYTNNFGSGAGKCNDELLQPSDQTTAQANPELGNDWVTVLTSSDPDGNGSTYDRFCGKVLHANNMSSTNTAVTSAQFPYRVSVHFDDSEKIGTEAELGLDDTSVVGAADRGDVGFNIGYKQNSC